MQLGLRLNINEMYIGTFHSICLRWLDEFREHTRLKKSYGLIDAFEQRYMLFQKLREFQEIEGSELVLGEPNRGGWKQSGNLQTAVNKFTEEALDAQALKSPENPVVRVLATAPLCRVREHTWWLQAGYSLIGQRMNTSHNKSFGANLMETFDDLLAASTKQEQPQRLLLVFTKAELPEGASAEQRTAFALGEGGHLKPTVCVDRLPKEIGSFAALRNEATDIVGPWDLLFVAAMAGRGGHAPNPDEAVQPLRMMVEQVRVGNIARFLAVRPDGRLAALELS